MGLADSRMTLIDSKGDGHCFARSLSTSLFGDQRLWKSVVALFALQCYENPVTNIRNEDGSPSGENFSDYLIARTLEYVPSAVECLEKENSDDLIYNLGVQSMLRAEISELWFSSVEADMLARKFDLDLYTCLFQASVGEFGKLLLNSIHRSETVDCCSNRLPIVICNTGEHWESALPY